MIEMISYRPGHRDLINPKKIFYTDECFNRFLDSCHLNPNCLSFTFIDEMRVIAIVGGNMIWPGVMELWSVISELVYKKPIEFHKNILKLIKNTWEAKDLHRMQMWVSSQHEEGMKWANALGFSYEGTAKRYGPMREDFYLYGRVS